MGDHKNEQPVHIYTPGEQIAYNSGWNCALSLMLVCFSMAASGSLVMHSSVYQMAEGRNLERSKYLVVLITAVGHWRLLSTKCASRVLDFSQYKKTIQLVQKSGWQGIDSIGAGPYLQVGLEQSPNWRRRVSGGTRFYSAQFCCPKPKNQLDKPLPYKR